MASVICLLDSDANCLIYRNYSVDFLPIGEIITAFKTIINQSNEPVIQHEGVNYIHIKNNDIIILIVSYYDHVNVMSMLVFLYKFNDILLNYFKVGELNKDLIIDNFNLIYELFDEIMDYGLVQLTDISILKDVIKLEVNEPQMKDTSLDQLEHEINSSILRTTTSSISWRPKGIFYKRNEFFVDVLEKVSLVVDPEFRIVKYQINGSINVKCYLSGMPKLKIGLNKLNSEQGTQFLANLHFDQCVELETFTKDKVIEFTPPDGQFELCSYTLSVKALPLLQILQHDFKEDKDKLLVKIKIRTNYKISANMKDLIIRIPIDLNRYSINFETIPKFKTKIGKVFYKFDENCIIWKVDVIAGGSEHVMMSQFELNTNNVHELIIEKEVLGMDPPPKSDKPKFNKIQEIVKEDGENNVNHGSYRNQNQNYKDILIDFEIPDLTLSSIKVDYLKIEEPQLKYTSFPWVRYKISNNDDYIYRL